MNVKDLLPLSAFLDNNLISSGFFPQFLREFLLAL